MALNVWPLAASLVLLAGGAAKAHHGEAGPHPVARSVQHRQVPRPDASPRSPARDAAVLRRQPRREDRPSR